MRTAKGLFDTPHHHQRGHDSWVGLRITAVLERKALRNWRPGSESWISQWVFLDYWVTHLPETTSTPVSIPGGVHPKLAGDFSVRAKVTLTNASLQGVQSSVSEPSSCSHMLKMIHALVSMRRARSGSSDTCLALLLTSRWIFYSPGRQHFEGLRVCRLWDLKSLVTGSLVPWMPSPTCFPPLYALHSDVWNGYTIQLLNGFNEFRKAKSSNKHTSSLEGGQQVRGWLM